MGYSRADSGRHKFYIIDDQHRTVYRSTAYGTPNHHSTLRGYPHHLRPSPSWTRWRKQCSARFDPWSVFVHGVLSCVGIVDSKHESACILWHSNCECRARSRRHTAYHPEIPQPKLISGFYPPLLFAFIATARCPRLFYFQHFTMHVDHDLETHHSQIRAHIFWNTRLHQLIKLLIDIFELLFDGGFGEHILLA